MSADSHHGRPAGNLGELRPRRIEVTESLRRDALWLVGVIAASYPLGLLISPLVALPLLNALPAWWAMTRRLRAGDRGGALALMLVFPVALAFFGVLTFSLWPTADGRTPAVFNGPEYRDEMFRWIRTGEGTEGDWRQFLPQHILHLVAFIVLSLTSASLISIVGGAVLTNYMSAYVASIHRADAPFWVTVFFGWPPWAICRVLGFCILGVVLAEPLLRRMVPYAWIPRPEPRRLIGWALGFILADWLLKATLAWTWRDVLKSTIP
jgi:hypothetical protein